MSRALDEIEAKVDRGDLLTESEVEFLFAEVKAAAKRVCVSEYLFPQRSRIETLERIEQRAALMRRIDEVLARHGGGAA